jgi:hypothetical protein
MVFFFESQVWKIDYVLKTRDGPCQKPVLLLLKIPKSYYGEYSVYGTIGFDYSFGIICV